MINTVGEIIPKLNEEQASLLNLNLIDEVKEDSSSSSNSQDIEA